MSAVVTTVAADIAVERREREEHLATFGERLVRPGEVECPVCLAFIGECCSPFPGITKIGKYHDERRRAALRQPPVERVAQ